MSSYIHFTEEQKQRAAAVNLEEFLRCRGEKLLSSGREKRLASDHSVTVRGNEWYDHAEERGGHAVSFVQRFYGLSYPDAVTMLLGGELGTAYPSAGERTEEPVKPFALPPANKDMRRVFAYLIKHRSIARDVVAHFAKAGLLYYHTCSGWSAGLHRGRREHRRNPSLCRPPMPAAAVSGRGASPRRR